MQYSRNIFWSHGHIKYLRVQCDFEQLLKECSILISINYNTLFITGFIRSPKIANSLYDHPILFIIIIKTKRYNQIGVSTVGSRQNSVRTIGTLSL